MAENVSGFVLSSQSTDSMLEFLHRYAVSRLVSEV